MGYNINFWKNWCVDLRMIDKLYKLKQLQVNQKILEKQQVLASIDQIEKDIQTMQNDQYSASLNAQGEIADFAVLQMHKNTMIHNIRLLKNRKKELLQSIDRFNYEIMELQKESEQFEYIQIEMQKELYKKRLKEEELNSAEYMQTKWIQNA